MDDLTIVTGGAGFIGSHLVKQLVDSGQQVRVVERPGTAVEHLPATVEVFFADIRDRAALRRALLGAAPWSTTWPRIPTCGSVIDVSSTK